MMIQRFSRMATLAAAVLFGGLAVAAFAAPDLLAHRLGLEAVRANGDVALRAELGGLFGGLTLLCAATFRTKRREWAIATMLVLTAIVAGRAIGWIVHRGPAGDVADLTIELATIVAVWLSVRSTPAVNTAPARSARLVAAAGLVTVIAAGAAVSLFGSSLDQAIFASAAKQQAGNNLSPLADDALRVAVCGSSAPLASAARAKACIAVFAGGKFYIVDSGPESTENLVLWGLPLSSVGGVFLTHFHSDHIGDLGELNLQTWAGGRRAPLPVYGGPGVDRVVNGFNDAYRLDQGYRTAHHTAAVMPPDTWPMTPHVVELAGAETAAKDRTAVVFDENGLRVTAIEVDHAPIAPAYAYRFDYKGRSAVITGDLKYHASMAKAIAGVDVMVSEAIAVHMVRAMGEAATANGRQGAAAIMHDIEDYHITPEQAAAVANDAHVKLLAFYHLLPAPDGGLLRRLFAQGIEEARAGDWTIADDGSLYTMPLNSTEVQIGTLRR